MLPSETVKDDGGGAVMHGAAWMDRQGLPTKSNDIP